MRRPLSAAEHERIYQGRLQNQTLEALAAELQCSVGCVRKWWRRLKAEGLLALRGRPRGRPVQGPLSSFPPVVRHQALQLKQRHHGWGADRILVALRQDPQFHGVRLPSRSQLAAFFKASCPECLAQYHPRLAHAAPSSASAAHEVWKLDAQEGIRLCDGTVATICNIRDPFAGAMIASQAVAVQTPGHWRRVTWQEYQQVLRTAATHWHTLPDVLQTDGELGLAGSSNDPFPGHFTLWLVGLGIEHRLSRPARPTDNAEVERQHRTLDGWALDPESLGDLPHLQQALDRECQMYNQDFPSRARYCDRHPPLCAHPELLQPRRPYAPEHEAARFALTRVDQYLSSFAFPRRVKVDGRISLGGQLYTVGRQFGTQTLVACFDATTREWVFFVQTALDTYQEQPVRCHIKHMEATDLTGL